MEISPARPDDHAAIATLWHDSASQMDGGVPNLDDPSRLKARIAENLATGWILEVASINGRIVGFLATVPETGVIDQLFVAPDVQRRGIGSALLDQAKRRLPNGFTLRTPLSNVAGHRFYERHGLRFLRDAPHPGTGIQVRYFGWLR